MKVHFEENTEENSEEVNDANVAKWIKTQVAAEVVCPLKKTRKNLNNFIIQNLNYSIGENQTEWSKRDPSSGLNECLIIVISRI